MKLRVLAVGRPRDDAAETLHDRYVERILRLGVAMETTWIPDVRAAGRHDEDRARARETRMLGERLAGEGRVVAVDPRGRTLTSEELARRLERWTSTRATFVIGGPRGLDASVREGADWCWSLSSLTLPHELVRVLVVEQLYRAVTLLRGLPYHR